MPQRIQRHRSKGWRKPANCVCVTRPGTFGNPFDSVEAFEAWIKRGEIYVSSILDRSFFPWTPESKERLRLKREKILARLDELKGKDLACFCQVGHSCHADILLEIANR